MPSPRFEPRPETAALVELLAATAPGVLLTFQQLSAAADLADIRQHDHLLQSARRIAEREHRVVFRNERTRGYRRLRTEQIPHVERQAAAHQRSVARQTIKTLIRGVERANDISPETQLRLNQGLARQGIISHVTARERFKVKIEPGAPPPSVTEIAQRLLQHVRPPPPSRRRSA